MRKQMTAALLVLMLACGCAGNGQNQNTASPEITAVPASPRAEEVQVPETEYGILRALSEQVGALAGEGKWEELSSLFSDASKKQNKAKDLKARAEEAGLGKVTLLETCPMFGEGTRGGYALFEGEDGTYEAAFAVDDSNALSDLQFAKRNEISQPEGSEPYEEYEITAGNAPKIHGILTLPAGAEDPPVAILLPEEMDDAMNESGSNVDFRKDLAHGLAENGIASVRFDMRLYEDPLLFSVFGKSFENMAAEDFAAIVHSLETFPVNARKIIYIGHGAGGTLGYAAAVAHFEMDGGLVLLNSPYTEDGAHLFQRAAWLEEEAAEEALSRMGEEESDPNEDIYGWPLSWWEKWQSLGALNYTRHVAIPILIIQAEDDGMVYFKKDYSDWKSQKGSNVTMKSYPKLGHDMKNAEGNFEPEVIEDIAAWARGEDITKKKKTGGKS